MTGPLPFEFDPTRFIDRELNSESVLSRFMAGRDPFNCASSLSDLLPSRIMVGVDRPEDLNESTDDLDEDVDKLGRASPCPFLFPLPLTALSFPFRDGAGTVPCPVLVLAPLLV